MDTAATACDIKAFCCPKSGNSAEEYEDAWAQRHTRSQAGIRVAVADGATESSFAKLWAVLLAGMQPPEAEALAGRICHEAALTGVHVDGEFVSTTVSIGLAAHAPGQSIDAAMRAADKAAYEAKRALGNHVTVHLVDNDYRAASDIVDVMSQQGDVDAVLPASAQHRGRVDHGEGAVQVCRPRGMALDLAAGGAWN